MASDAGDLLSEGEPFAATYSDTAENRVFSLRSRPEGIDVSEIAKLFGGVGHRHAAGFRIHRDHPLAIGTLEDGASGVARIAAERQRQIHAEGYKPANDSCYIDSELARAAACYAMPDLWRAIANTPEGTKPHMWPWRAPFWKPGDHTVAGRLRELEKAGALIAAEIDRLTAKGVSHG
jgi:hypothetical protein